jgi:hypothetical protein
MRLRSQFNRGGAIRHGFRLCQPLFRCHSARQTWNGAKCAPGILATNANAFQVIRSSLSFSVDGYEFVDKSEDENESRHAEGGGSKIYGTLEQAERAKSG